MILVLIIFIGWYLLGLIPTMLAAKIDNAIVTVSDLVWILFACLLGPVFGCFVLYYIIDNTPVGKKKLYWFTDKKER